MFKGNLLDGYGTYTNSFMRYQGYFKEDEGHGEGKVHMLSGDNIGDIYEGTWEGSLKHG